MKENILLAISPGTREIGVAVFADSDLLYYAVKTITNRKGIENICKGAACMVRQLIAEFQPQALALIRPLVIQQSGARLVAVIRDIKAAAQQQGVTVHEYAPKTVQQYICGSERWTRRRAATVLAARYPELSQYAEGRSIGEEIYYAKMFGAVAVGVTDYYSRETGSSSLPN